MTMIATPPAPQLVPPLALHSVAPLPPSPMDDAVARGLHAVRQRLSLACLAAHRPPGSVGLLAVSKTQSAASVRAAYAAGQTAFGENYIQEALDKMDALRDLPLQWHCIGPVQSNKTKPVAERFDWVHSVDRLKIAERLSAQRPDTMAPLQICLQINLDGGPNKGGVSARDAPALALLIAALPRLVLRGIMTIPEPADSFAAQQALHARALAVFGVIKDQLAQRSATQAAQFDTLSLGMSDDLEAAVHAGSSMVRIGTAIFGARAAKDSVRDVGAT